MVSFIHRALSPFLGVLGSGSLGFRLIALFCSIAEQKQNSSVMDSAAYFGHDVCHSTKNTTWTNEQG